MSDTPNNTPNNPDNSSSDPWGDEMTSEFDRRVRDLHEAPLTLDQVKGKAVTIKNKRRAAVAGAVLAAAAVIVPVAVAAGNGFGHDKADVAPATSTPSETATDPATPDPTPDPTPPPAAGAGVAYLEGADYHRADGTVTTLPSADYLDAAVLGDQVAAYRFAGENGVVDLIDGQTVSQTYEVRTSMVTAPDGATVAFVTTDDELVFLNGEHGEQSLGKVDPDVTLSAIIGDGDCGLESGCHPFLEHADFTTGDAFEINYEGPETAPAPGALQVHDADDRFLVSVTTKVTDDSTCGGLFERRSQQWVFQTCEHQVQEISPTGEFTTAFPSYYDGLGPGSFSILGTDGEPVAEKTAKDGVVERVGWLDDTHAVATVYDDGAWKIISLGVDGEEKVLVEGAAGAIEESPYHLTGL
ncbi:hypothetical protein [Nocardioides plantarum]|uniref:Uncharacterized protein n=1 Tax=Nocardioides plantarum TaxID=29299 RepID=A0ABV5KAB7_9ACTN|nr:hypothetical protein [Nocardioides plantarum]